MTNPSDSESVTIVPVREYAFNKLMQDKIYSYPSSTKIKIHEIMAFYRSEPVSAITHIGNVQSVEKGEIDTKYKAICFGDRFNESPIIVNISDIRELDDPVRKSHYGIQGKTYSDLNSVKDAGSLDDL